MRVSSNSQYMLGTYGLQTKQAQLNHLQEQLSTLRRVVRPSDDPVAATQAVSVAQSQSMNEQQIKNAGMAASQLAITDTALQSASTTIANIKTLAIQAGNGALSNDNRKAIQNEMRERVKELIGLANTSDGSGNFIFGGTRKDVAPFVQAGAAGATYQGDQQRQEVPIASGRELPITEVGNDIFTPGLWASLASLDTALTQGPGGSPTYTADLQAVMSGLDKGLATLLAGQASVGGRQQEITSLQDLGESMAVQYASQMSNLVDLDFAKATSEFQMAMTALQTSQKTYAQIGQLTLFNHI